MTPSAFRRALASIPLAATLALILGSPHAAFAGRSTGCVIASTHAWTYAWRPNWLPGDPTSDELAPMPYSAAAWTPGLMIAIDPVTRRPVTPTPEQRRAMSEAMRGGALGAPIAPNAPLRTEKLPGGGEVTYLDGRFEVYMVARRDANGHIVTDCVPDAESVNRIVSQPAPARAKEDR